MNIEKNKAPKKIEYATSNFTDNESFSAVETFVLESNNNNNNKEEEEEEPPYVGQIVNTAHTFKLLNYSLNKIINSNNIINNNDKINRIKLNKQMNSYEVEKFLF